MQFTVRPHPLSPFPFSSLGQHHSRHSSLRDNYHGLRYLREFALCVVVTSSMRLVSADDYNVENASGASLVPFLVAAVGLALASAVFSGLTLGLMSLDVLQLQILIHTDDARRTKLQQMQLNATALSDVVAADTGSMLRLASHGDATTRRTTPLCPLADLESGHGVRDPRDSPPLSNVAREDSVSTSPTKSSRGGKLANWRLKRRAAHCARRQRKRMEKADHTERDARRARRIYRVRRDGNLLLVSLLIGNVAVNSGFSILMGDLTSGVMGFLVSTVVLTLFGEIVPQAICSKYGLEVGYYFVPFVIAVEFILFPIAKPIAMVLDWLLGGSVGTAFNRQQLKALVGHHCTSVKLLAKEEAKILEGGLEFARTPVGSVMTPLSAVFGIDIHSKLDITTVSSMVAHGYSRVPVLDRSQPQCIVGLLHLKDIVLLDFSQNFEANDVLPFLGRPVYTVDSNTTLLSLLSDFKKGHTHLAVVRELEEDSSVEGSRSSPYFAHVGIICLEDVLEEILQDEIYDEYEGLRPYQLPSMRAMTDEYRGVPQSATASRDPSNSGNTFLRSLAGLCGAKTAKNSPTPPSLPSPPPCAAPECERSLDKQRSPPTDSALLVALRRLSRSNGGFQPAGPPHASAEKTASPLLSAARSGDCFAVFTPAGDSTPRQHPRTPLFSPRNGVGEDAIEAGFIPMALEEDPSFGVCLGFEGPSQFNLRGGENPVTRSNIAADNHICAFEASRVTEHLTDTHQEFFGEDILNLERFSRLLQILPVETLAQLDDNLKCIPLGGVTRRGDANSRRRSVTDEEFTARDAIVILEGSVVVTEDGGNRSSMLVCPCVVIQVNEATYTPTTPTTPTTTSSSHPGIFAMCGDVRIVRLPFDSYRQCLRDATQGSKENDYHQSAFGSLRRRASRLSSSSLSVNVFV